MVSAKTGEGFDDWLNWLKMKVKGKKRNITKKQKGRGIIPLPF